MNWQRPQKQKIGEKCFSLFALVATLLPLCALALLIIPVFLDGIERINGDFITNLPDPDPKEAGIITGLIGTIFTIGLTTLFAVPIGIGAAIYLEEYRQGRGRFAKWMAELIEVNIANLAAVPSIIYGLLGLSIFVRAMGFGPSVLAGALTLALLILPIIIMASREALRVVPPKLKEGAYGLGATRWQTTRRVVLPMALPGMITGSILAISRAIGETAPLIMVGAASAIFFFSAVTAI